MFKYKKRYINFIARETRSFIQFDTLVLEYIYNSCVTTVLTYQLKLGFIKNNRLKSKYKILNKPNNNICIQIYLSRKTNELAII